MMGSVDLVRAEIIGDGPPVLVLPGFGMTGWLFRGPAERLKDRARFVLVDNRGTGRSPGNGEDYSLTDLAEDALKLMTHLGFDRFAVIGISMGGLIAQCLYKQAPDRVTGMALLCTLGPGPDYQSPPTFEESDLRRLYKGDRETAVRGMVKATVHPRVFQEDPELVETIVDHRLANLVSVDELIRQQRAVLPFLRDSQMETVIECPLLIMSGLEDRVVPVENTRLLAARHPNTETAFFEESDHFFFLEKEEQVTRVLAHFLERL